MSEGSSYEVHIISKMRLLDPIIDPLSWDVRVRASALTLFLIKTLPTNAPDCSCNLPYRTLLSQNAKQSACASPWLFN